MSAPGKKDLFIPLLTLAADIVAIESAFLFSYWLRFFSPLTGWFAVTKGIPDIAGYVESSLVVIPVWTWLFAVRGLYRPRRAAYFSDEFFAVLRVVAWGMVIVMAGAFFYRGFSYSRLVFAMLGATSVGFLAVGRFIVLKFEQYWYARGNDLKDAVIVGTNDTARRVFANIHTHPGLGYRVVGYFTAGPRDRLRLPGSRKLGTVNDVPGYIRSHRIDIVFVALEYRDHPRLLEMVRDCEGVNTEIMMVPDLLELMTGNVRVKELAGIPFLSIKGIPIGSWNAVVKRAFDVAFGTAVLVLMSPLFLVLAVFIKLESRGPVLYRQERVGLDGRKFMVMKFRSMRADAEQRTGPVWASKNDPRVTRLGKFLRRWSLDELPQLFNVIGGAMSIVGPRPERPHFVEQFRKAIPKYLERHRVKTGMTGWAQVNGLRGNAPIAERTKYDVYYVENWSLVFDIKIIFKTLRAVVFGKDAY